jgi:rare lipoprotein A (peptidoglycan hydrolase)
MPEPEIIETDCIEFTIEIQHSNLEEDKENKNEAEPTKTNKATASYYTTEYCEKFNPSCLTASGDVFTDEGFTAACADSFDLGDRVLLTSEKGSVEVVCNDRGSFEEKYGRAFDLSTAAFTKLAALSQGVVEVEYQVIK